MGEPQRKFEYEVGSYYIVFPLLNTFFWSACRHNGNGHPCEGGDSRVQAPPISSQWCPTTVNTNNNNKKKNGIDILNLNTTKLIKKIQLYK